MKILIVDDEYLLREKLASVLKNSGLPIQSIFVCENVWEAMKTIDQEAPDIVLSDIRMPQKSGLDLAEYVHEKSPDTPVILITGYSDFAYAQSAIQHRVFDYLLKPVEAEKLVSCVARARKTQELQEKHQRLYQTFQEYFNQNIRLVKKQYIEGLLFHRATGESLQDQQEALGFDFKRFRLVAVSCSTAIESGRIEGEYYCSHLVDQYTQERLPRTVSYRFGNLVFFLWEVQENEIFQDNENLILFLQELNTYLRRNFLGVLSGGISRCAWDLSSLDQLRRQASECLDYSSSTGKKELLFYEDIVQTEEANWSPEESLRQLSTAVFSGRREEALRIFDDIVETLTAFSTEFVASSYLLIVSNLSFQLQERKLNAVQVSAKTNQILSSLYGGETDWMTHAVREWLESACQFVEKDIENRSNLIVESVYEYINAHYRENIGLTDASRQVGRNPSYVSRLIKECTGKNFTSLLTSRRMEAAKYLLKNTNLKIAEVAEKTGYPNARYFNRVFKTSMNMSANDYRSFTNAFD